MTARLQGQVALVTGGASGLGRAVAGRLGSEGASVIITDIEPDSGRRAAAELEATFIEQDVSDEAGWDQVINDIEERFGRLDVLINNAGIVGATDAINPENTRFADWKRIFAINVDGVFLGCRAAIPAMRRAGGGSIVNVSSVAGLLATPYATAYGASKATVRQLTKSVAQHCAEQGLRVRCNSVHPGDVLTPLWDRLAADRAAIRGVSPEQVIAEAAARVPLGGSLTLPEDIAGAVAFLCSDDARQITGLAMIVDGGLINCDTFQMRLSRES